MEIQHLAYLLLAYYSNLAGIKSTLITLEIYIGEKGKVVLLSLINAMDLMNSVILYKIQNATLLINLRIIVLILL